LGPSAFKAVTVAEPEQLELAARNYLGRRPRRTDEPGLLLHLSGAVAAAWDLAAGPAGRVPLILAASSLGPDTVAAALAGATPWAVDVWDAVESEPGRLDPTRLAEFIRATREADATMAPTRAKEAKT
jgi:phosphoribosylanthranilate isomerase